VCGDGVCDAGEALTCADDCVSCGDGTCSDGEDCCTDCGCGDEKTCDAITLRCVTVEKEKTISFRHEAVPDTGTGTATGTGEGTGTPPEDEKEIAEVRQSVADVAALVTRSRAAQSGSGTGGAVSAVQVKAMVERSVEATREVDVGREVIVRNTSDGERSTVSVVVRNDGNTPRRNVRVVETIPKDVAGSAGQLAFDPPPDFVLKDDPIVGWNVDLLPGEEVTFTYTVAQDISDVVTYQRPVVIVEEVEEEPPVPACGDGTCEAGEDCASCPGDCTCPVEPVCGDGSCEAGESKGTCCEDCGCLDGEACSDGACAAVETAAAGTPTSLILGAVLAIIIATGMVALFTMRRQGVEEAVEELPIAEPTLIAKPVKPAEIEEVPAVPQVVPGHALAAAAGLAAPHPHGLAEQVLMPRPAATPVATAAFVAGTLTPPVPRPPPTEAEKPAMHSEAGEVERRLRGRALHEAMHREPTRTNDEEVAWCTSFLRTYRKVDLEWLRGLLLIIDIDDAVVDVCEQRVVLEEKEGIAPPAETPGPAVATAEVVEEVSETTPVEPEVIDPRKERERIKALRSHALHEAMHTERPADAEYDDNVAWCVLFLRAHGDIETRWLRNLLLMAGYSEDEVYEAERLWGEEVEDEVEPDAVVV